MHVKLYGIGFVSIPGLDFDEYLCESFKNLGNKSAASTSKCNKRITYLVAHHGSRLRQLRAAVADSANHAGPERQASVCVQQMVQNRFCADAALLFGRSSAFVRTPDAEFRGGGLRIRNASGPRLLRALLYFRVQKHETDRRAGGNCSSSGRGVGETPLETSAKERKTATGADAG